MFYIRIQELQEENTKLGILFYSRNSINCSIEASVILIYFTLDYLRGSDYLTQITLDNYSFELTELCNTTPSKFEGLAIMCYNIL